MTPDTLPKRIFFCLLIIILVFGAMGCTSVKYDWCPDPILKKPDNKEVDGAVARIVKVSF